MTSNRNVSPGDIIQAIDLTALDSDEQRRNALVTLQRVLCAEAVPLARELDRYTQKYGGDYPGVVELAVRLETNKALTSELVTETVRTNIAPVIVDEHTFAVHGLFLGPGGGGLPNLTVALYDGPTASATWAQGFGYTCTNDDGYYILKAINPGATPVFLQARDTTGKPVYLADAPLTPQAGFVNYDEIVISGEPLGCPPPAPQPPATVDLRITAADSPDPVTPEITLTYTLTVTNQSQIDAKDLKVTDTLPAQTTFVSASGGGFTCAHSSGVVTCTLPSLAAGATATITILVKVSKDVTHGTVLSNTATVTATAIKPDATNNTAVTTTSVVSAADLSVVMTDAPDPVVAGQNLTYTVIVNNSAVALAAQNVTVTGAVPDNTTFDSASCGADWTPTLPPKGGSGNVSFSKASVAPGESATFQIVVKVNQNTPASTTISNTARVTSATTDKNAANNTSTTTTAMKPSADLGLIKTNAPKEVAPAGTITYIVTISNNGPDAAENVTVTDTVPANTIFVSARVTAGNGWTPNASSARATGAGDVVFSKPAVTRGETATFEIVVTVNESAAASTVIKNTATVGSTTTDPNTNNNAATTTTIVKVPTADLSITKSDTPDPVVAGQNVIYTLQVTNPVGASAAQTVTVTDAVPANTTFVSAEVTSGSGWTPTLPKAGSGSGNVVFSKALVAAGETASFQMVVKVNADTTVASISNTATVTSPTSDKNAANNTTTIATSVIALPASADLQILKTDDPNPVAPGGNVTYTLTVYNAGPSAAQTVTMTDPVPANTTFVSAEVTSGTGWTPATPAVGSSGNVAFSKASIAVGETATFKIVVNVNQNTQASTTIINTATVTSPTSDPNTDNTAIARTTVTLPSADLSITKIVSIAPGGIITYFLTITNNGPKVAENVKVTDPIPANTTLVSARVTSGDGWATNAPPVGSTGNVVFSKASVVPGETASFQIVVKLNPNAPVTTINNTATVTSSTTDLDPTHNTVEVIANVQQPKTRRAVIVFAEVNKAGDHTPLQGSPQPSVTFTDNVPNSGDLEAAFSSPPSGFKMKQFKGVTMAVVVGPVDADIPARLKAVSSALQKAGGAATLTTGSVVLSAGDQTTLARGKISIADIDEVIFVELAVA